MTGQDANVIHKNNDSNMLFEDDWDTLIKSHLYSRKEFKNGEWRYYYDKHNNFSRMTRCESQTLKIDTYPPTIRLMAR